jgi:hypothetical protein
VDSKKMKLTVLLAFVSVASAALVEHKDQEANSQQVVREEPGVLENITWAPRKAKASASYHRDLESGAHIDEHFERLVYKSGGVNEDDIRAISSGLSTEIAQAAENSFTHAAIEEAHDGPTIEQAHDGPTIEEID